MGDAGDKDRHPERAAERIDWLPRCADLLRAGRRLLRLLPAEKASLRVIPDGFRWTSDVLTLDLSRYGIVVRHAAVVPPARQRRILEAVALIAEELGFDNSYDAGLDELPPVGAAVAVHAAVRVMEHELAVRVHAGSNQVESSTETPAPADAEDDLATIDDDLPDLC